jgi:cytoskeletal protein RodZ
LFDIGASLTAAREAQGLVLADAERLTCLRERYLLALEEDRFEALPGHAYARAFLRSYADVLSLDADRFVAEFDQRFPEHAAESAAPLFGGHQPRRAGRHNRLRWPRS